MNKKQLKVIKISKLRFKTLLQMIAALLFLCFISFLFTEKHYFIGLLLLWIVLEGYLINSYIRPLELELRWIADGLLDKDMLQGYKDDKFLYYYIKTCIEKNMVYLDIDIADFYKIVTKEIEKNYPNEEFNDRKGIRSFMRSFMFPNQITEESFNDLRKEEEHIERYRDYASIWAKGSTIQLNLVFKKGKLSRVYYSNINE